MSSNSVTVPPASNQSDMSFPLFELITVPRTTRVQHRTIEQCAHLPRRDTVSPPLCSHGPTQGDHYQVLCKRDDFSNSRCIHHAICQLRPHYTLRSGHAYEELLRLFHPLQ